MSPFVVDVVVGMRTEAKPCSLGRSVSAHPNQRRSDLLPGNRCPHSLVGLAPRMVFFPPPHHHGPGERGKSGIAFSKGCMKLRRAVGPPRRLRSTVFSMWPPADIPLTINPQARSPLQQSRPRVFSRLATALQVVKLL